MNFPLLDFALACILMGLGIGLDVATATIAHSKQLQTCRATILWIVGVSTTHTLFPMVGYVLTYFGVQLNPKITPLIGVLAFAFIFLYLKAELRNNTHPEQKKNESTMFITLGLILAVSWDALWSGPAKSAQVIGWPEYMVWVSFVFVGTMVAILAIGSLRLSHICIRITEKNRYLSWLGSWLQYSVIGYFGLLALMNYTLNIELIWWQTLLISGFLIATSMWLSMQSRNNNFWIEKLS